MSRTLKLMEETDLQQVAAAVAEALSPREAACSLNFQHDEERLALLVETNVPAEEVGAVWRDALPPLLAKLEGEFGEFSLEMRALCACGAPAMPMISGPCPDLDICLCGECLNRSVDDHRDGPRNTCPICERGFDGSGWSVSCKASFTDKDGAGPEMDIRTIRIGGPDSTDMSRWECCSRGCALKQFQEWLSEVEAHPVAKEARP